MAKNATETVKEEKSIRPITIRNTDTNEIFVLEFSRESIRFAENQGFNISNLDKFTMTGVEDLFYYSFRMHHMKVSRDKAMKVLYNDLGGMPEGMIERLVDLYVLALNSLVQDDERKNSNVTVEF